MGTQAVITSYSIHYTKLYDTHGGNDETIMRALLAKYDIRESEVNFFSVRYDYTPFYQGKVDLWPLYRNAQAPIIGAKLQKAGERFDLMDPSKMGIRFVAIV